MLEPEHDPSWERSVQSGVWERPVTALPGEAALHEPMHACAPHGCITTLHACITCTVSSILDQEAMLACQPPFTCSSQSAAMLGAACAAVQMPTLGRHGVRSGSGCWRHAER